MTTLTTNGTKTQYVSPSWRGETIIFIKNKNLELNGLFLKLFLAFRFPVLPHGPPHQLPYTVLPSGMSLRYHPVSPPSYQDEVGPILHLGGSNKVISAINVELVVP